MSQTEKVLRAEAKRLRELADKIDGLLAELVESPASEATAELPGLGKRETPVVRNPNGEFSSLTQADAILKALAYGPQTTAQLFQRLNAGGQKFKNATYVSSVAHRLIAKGAIDRADGKLRLKPGGHATAA